MKKFKLLPLFALLSLFVTSCVNSNVEKAETLPPSSISEWRFHGTRDIETSRGVAQRDRLWYPGTTINVRFLNGTSDQQQFVKDIILEEDPADTTWLDVADIHLNFVDTDADAHVRIAFDWNNNRHVTWSYIGTDCKMNPDQNDATLSFAASQWRYLSDEEVRGEVLRAFGQVLGLELESRHIDFDENLWSERFPPQEYWEGEIEDAAWAELQEYVFTKLQNGNTIHDTEFDRESIMNWPFPGGARYGVMTDLDLVDNNCLSRGDIDFISKLYPQNGGEIIIDRGIAVIAGVSVNDITVTGDVELVPDGDNVIVEGEEGVVYSLKINGDVTTLNVAASTGLKLIEIKNAAQLESLDLSSNVLLENVAIYNAPNFINLTIPTESTTLRYVYLTDTGINSNGTLLAALANSLPDRTGANTGHFNMTDNDPVELVWETCDGKNWNVSPTQEVIVHAGSNEITFNSNAKYYWKSVGSGYWQAWGDPESIESIESISADGVTMPHLELAWLPNVSSISIKNVNDLRYLDFTNCELLKNVSINGAPDLNFIRLTYNLYLTTIDIESTGLIDLLLPESSDELRTINVKNNNLWGLYINNLPNLSKVYCEGNPFSEDEGAVRNISSQLPSRLGMHPGTLHTGNSTFSPTVSRECYEKNWILTPPAVLLPMGSSADDLVLHFDTSYAGDPLLTGEIGGSIALWADAAHNRSVRLFCHYGALFFLEYTNGYLVEKTVIYDPVGDHEQGTGWVNDSYAFPSDNMKLVEDTGLGYLFGVVSVEYTN